MVNVSSLSRQIQVEFDNISGCFDQWILICESISSKQRSTFPNSTICTDLIANESYRIHVEIERTGLETVRSNSLEIKLNSTSKPVKSSSTSKPIKSDSTSKSAKSDSASKPDQGTTKSI